MVLTPTSYICNLRESINHTDEIGQNYDANVTAFQSGKGDTIADKQEV